MPFELFVAVRYLLARRRQAFISLISLISVIGVGVGVMALLIALALMTGLQTELRDRIVGSAAHIYVFRIGGMEMARVEDELQRFLELPRVEGAAPVILGKAMIRSGKGHEAFIDVKGILPERERTVTRLAVSMRAGTVETIERAEEDVPGILLGTDLARTLDVVPGERVQLLSPQGTITPFGAFLRPRTFEVTGLFNLGLFEFDSSYGFVHLDIAARMLPDQTPIIELRIDDMFRVEEVVRTIAARFGAEYTAQHWADLNRSLFAALWLEKVAISITIGLIVMVAALNIIASLILLVMEKSRDIAILKTMGSSSASIRRIFVLQGLIIGLVGTAAGALAGTALIYVLDRYRLISVPMDVYQISYVPFTLELSDFLTVIIAAILICFVATIYPSRQAAKLDPAQALRYQ
jgi:lipoprotein-releasing system permease protein